MSEVTFKAIPFFVQSDSLEVGRDQKEKDFPYQDKVTFADLGLKSRRFPFRAYVLADPPGTPPAGASQAKSAREKARALMEVCQSQGAGELKIPWLGTFRVVNTRCTLQRPQGQTRRIEFALEFVEAGELAPFRQPLPSLDTDSIGQRLSDAYAKSLLPLEPDQRAAWQATLEEGADSLKNEQSFLSDFNHLARTLLRGGGALSALLAPLGQIERSLSLFQSSITTLLNKPDEFAQTFFTLAHQIASLGQNLGLNTRAAIRSATAGHQQSQINALLHGVRQGALETEPSNPLAHNQARLKHFQKLTHLSIALSLASHFKPAFKEQGEALAQNLLETLDALLGEESPFSIRDQATVQGLLERATFETLNGLHQKTQEAPQSKRLQIEQATPLLQMAFHEKTTFQHLLENNRHFLNPLRLKPQTEIIL